MCAVRWGPAHSLRVGVCLPRHHWPDFLLHSPFELAMTVCGLFLGFAVCSVRPPIDDRVQKLACPWSTGVRPAAAHACTDWDAGSGESPAGPLGPAAQAPHLRTRLLLGVFRLWCPLVSRLLRKPRPSRPGPRCRALPYAASLRTSSEFFFSLGAVVTAHARPASASSTPDEGKVSCTSPPPPSPIQTPVRVTGQRAVRR